MEYHRSKVNAKVQKYYDAIRDGYLKQDPEILLPGLREEDTLSDLIEAVKRDHPEIFYVKSAYSYRRYPDRLELLPRYAFTGETLKKREEEIRAAVEKILDQLKKSGAKTAYQRCVFLHNYLVRNCIYDDEAYRSSDADEFRCAYTIEGPLLEGKAVCAGVAKTYALLCTRLGIEAIYISGVSLKPGETFFGRHAWNIICEKDAAVQIDVTWDMCVTNPDLPVRYDYFFLSDIEMMRDHNFIGYPRCRNFKISYFDKRDAYLKDTDAVGQFVVRETNRHAVEERFFLYFKMQTGKIPKEQVEKAVSEALRMTMQGGYSYTLWRNEAQSVYFYKIEKMKAGKQ